jgi:hypothetical protein
VVTPTPVVIVDGATPTPPPTIMELAASVELEVQVDGLEKYGTPPDVPATVNASVPVVVTGEPETAIKPPVNDCPTLVTVPVPLGVAQVPSPRQKVVADADVPLLSLATGKLPVTPVARGNPVALVKVTLVGVPRIGVIRVGLVERTTEPDPVAVVTPVPPLVTPSVPARVIAPLVAVEGVKPAKVDLNDDTEPEGGAVQDAVIPFELKTVPDAPIPNRLEAFVPVPTIRSPTVVIGDKALNAAAAVV